MYSIDIRRLAFIKLQKTGGRIRQTARMMELSPSTICRWAKEGSWNKSGSRKQRRRPALTEHLCDKIRQFYTIPKNQGVSLSMLRRRMMLADTQVYIPSITTLRRCMKIIRLSRKRLSNKVLGQMQSYQVLEYSRRLSDVNGCLMVSMDECNFSEKVVPLYGYSPIGEGCKTQRHKGTWINHSLVLAIASDGTRYHAIKKGSVKRNDFADIVRSLPFPPGTTLILDNCSIHKKLDDVYKSKGYIPMFLPAYAPQFQPVELAFSKIKGHFRQFWPWDDGVVKQVEKSIMTLRGTDNIGFFKHAEKCLRNKLNEIGDAGCTIISG